MGCSSRQTHMHSQDAYLLWKLVTLPAEIRRLTLFRRFLHLGHAAGSNDERMCPTHGLLQLGGISLVCDVYNGDGALLGPSLLELACRLHCRGFERSALVAEVTDVLLEKRPFSAIDIHTPARRHV